MNTLDLDIEEMHCDGCATRIRSLLEKESGVREAAVSFKTGIGHFIYNPQSTDEARIIAIIERAGFTSVKA